MIGFFVDTLVLRTAVGGELRFLDLLARVRETVLQAFAHAELPLQQLVDRLRPERDLSRSPLFQILFVMQDAPAAIAIPGLAVSRIEQAHHFARYDLTVSISETVDGAVAAFEYNVDLFDRETIERLAECYRTILERVAADASERVQALGTLPPAERQRLLVEWNATDVAFAETTVPALFAAQARRTPDAIAVRFEGAALTYRELDARASLLADKLTTHGVAAETLVVVCLERSLDLVVALLAVLEGGRRLCPAGSVAAGGAAGVHVW